MNKFRKCLTYFLLLIAFVSLSSCSKNSEADLSNKIEESLEVKETPETLINNILNNGKASNEKVAQVENKNSERVEISSDEIEEKEIKESKKEISKNEKSIRIKAFGDIMSHLGQINYALYAGGGQEHDFSEQFKYMSDFISDADLSIGNFESTSNPNLEYSGFPKFNSPEKYLLAIKNSGFDILTTANNHSLDTGVEGVKTTVNAMDKYGIEHVGTRADNQEDRVLYKFVDGIKLAFLSYTYDTNGLENQIEDIDITKYINYLDDQLIKEDIEAAKNNKADFIIVYPHWGVEYQASPSQDQIELGRNMIEWGADLVIGNHPHVVQPAEYYTTEDGRRGFIAYSCGNYISQQSLESVGDIRTEHSVAYELELSKDFDNQTTRISDISAYPLWVGSNYDEFGMSIKTYLCKDFLENGKYYDLVDENQRHRIEEAYKMVSDTITSSVN